MKRNLPLSSRVFSYVLFFLIALPLIGNSQEAFKIKDEKNPWMDNYLPVADMQSFQQWGTYNVHDPSCLLVGDTYYMYSTDAILGEDRASIKQNNLPFGYIQMRKSKDLVHWEFVGWVFNQIPSEASEWVVAQSGGMKPNSVWAPYILKYKNKFRLYFSVSAFGKQTSCIGFAEAKSPEGPWKYKGCVVKTKTGDKMNAIDPSIVTEPTSGKQWMCYGSYFGGLYSVALNPKTGFTLRSGDQGHLIARRFNGKKNNIEASEIIYNPHFKKYYLFVSYDPLMTTYNVRVGRSDSPDGPFIDLFGKDMKEEEDNFPILIYPYRFQNHPGWAGTGHCSVFTDNKGNFYMAHQGRLSPENQQMVLHVRQIFWTENGWPTLSPERYDATPQTKIEEKDLVGEWEYINIQGKIPKRDLDAGQILYGQNHLKENEVDTSQVIQLNADHTITGAQSGSWNQQDNQLKLNLPEGGVSVVVFDGHDWENQKQTILFTGLGKQGNSIWGKRIK